MQSGEVEVAMKQLIYLSAQVCVCELLGLGFG